MNNNIPFGYKYDEENQKLVINENEQKIINVIFDLCSNYYLSSDEITNLANNNTTIMKIIADRIYAIYSLINQNNPNMANRFDYINIEEDINVGKQEQEKIISYLQEDKDKVQTFDSSIKNVIVNDIDRVIQLIKNIDEITNKYGNFDILTNSNTTFQYKEIDDLISRKFSKKEILNSNHEKLISDERWEECFKKFSASDIER